MSEIYYNPKLYPSKVDYIIGGFYSDESDSIDYNTIVTELRTRIKELIDNFLEREIEVVSKNGGIVSMDMALDTAYNVVNNYLGIMSDGTSVDGLVETLMESDQIERWLFNVKFTFNQNNTIAYSDVLQSKSYTDSKAKGTEKYKAAAMATDTDETTFEQWIEAVSQIMI